MQMHITLAPACILSISVFAALGAAQEQALSSGSIRTIRELRQREIRSPSTAVLIQLAIAYSDVRQFRLFESTMMEAQKLDPTNHLPPYFLGRYYLSVQDDVSKAEEHFTKAVARAADDFRSLYFLGYCDELQSRAAAAETRYRAAAKLAEAKRAKFSLAYEGLARLRLNASEPEDALPYARLAAAASANDASPFRTLARCLNQLKQYKAAAQALQTAARLEPADAPTWYSLYRTLRSAGDPAGAEEALSRFKRLAGSYSAQ